MISTTTSSVELDLGPLELRVMDHMAGQGMLTPSRDIYQEYADQYLNGDRGLAKNLFFRHLYGPLTEHHVMEEDPE